MAICNQVANFNKPKTDPDETTVKESALHIRRFADNMWTFVPAQQITGKFPQTFVDFPPLSSSSLGINKVLQQLQTAPASRQ